MRLIGQSVLNAAQEGSGAFAEGVPALRFEAYVPAHFCDLAKHLDARNPSAFLMSFF